MTWIVSLRQVSPSVDANIELNEKAEAPSEKVDQFVSFTDL